jgi:hypothetical protein
MNLVTPVRKWQEKGNKVVRKWQEKAKYELKTERFIVRKYSCSHYNQYCLSKNNGMLCLCHEEVYKNLLKPI